MHKGFRFYPGQMGLLKNYFKIKSWYFPNEFLESNTPIYDYALLRLTEKTNIKEFIPLKEDLLSISEGSKVAIFGYSGSDLVNLHPEDQYQLELYQWGLIRGKDRVEDINIEKGEIVHKISTVKGQSGAPIILINSNN